MFKIAISLTFIDIINSSRHPLQIVANTNSDKYRNHFIHLPSKASVLS